MACRPESLVARSAAGFTLLELVMVIILLGILSAVAIPRITDTSAFSQMAFHDGLVATLRHAQKTAVSHRRLVCVTLGGRGASARIAPARTQGCTVALPGPDGKPEIVASDTGVSVSPTGTLYFQPNGDITTDAGGKTHWNTPLQATGMPPIEIVGATGYVW
ncbi:MAG: type II secretion system GspH family protein [Azoarcus sp.]|jgi:MSHA pilin protein MshC|nr:type II secretion system GspH family protein [Azoarcus sp.]